MKKPSVTVLKKYITAMAKSKAKYVTSERLSKMVGVYPEIINEQLSYFDPMITMDYSFDLLELIPQMKQFIIDEEEKKTNAPKKQIITKKLMESYDSIGDFIYQKMTVGGGIVDRNAELSDKDLKILKRIIIDEQARRKKK